jgi:hypothetical protein
MWENDNLTLSEKKKVRDLVRNFADIFATQAQDLEACTLEQFQINVIEGFAIPTATRTVPQIGMTSSLNK